MQNKLITILISAFLGVLAWIWASTYSKLAEIEQGLLAVKMELVQIQAQMMTEDRVREIVEHEILKRVK